MRRALAPTAVAALALTLAITPALAQQQRRQGRTVPPPPSAQSYAPQPYAQPWSGRPDPLFGNRIGIDNERAAGRCVVDLGYGRWEPC